MIIYFRDENHKSKKRSKKYKTLTTILKSFDTFVIIATASNSITLSLAGIGSIVIPISTCIKYGLTTSRKVNFEVIMQKYNIYKIDIRKVNKLLNLLINYKEKNYRKI